MPKLNTGAATKPDDVDVLVAGTDVDTDGDAGANDEPNTGAVNGALAVEPLDDDDVTPLSPTATPTPDADPDDNEVALPAELDPKRNIVELPNTAGACADSGG